MADPKPDPDEPVDPDVVEQATPVGGEDDESLYDPSDRPLTPDEIEQRREVDYADDEY